MFLSEVGRSLQARLRRIGPWLLAFGLPMGGSLPALVHPAIVQSQPIYTECLLALWCSWPVWSFLAPAAWQWTGSDRPTASWVRALGQCWLLATLLALWASPLASRLAWGNFDYWMDHTFGLSLVLTLAGFPLGGLLAGWEALAVRAMAARQQWARLDWLARQDPFSPQLLFRSLEDLANRAGDSPAAAEEGLLALARVYRRWLDLNRQGVSTLGEERALALSLLELAAVRGKRVVVRWDWPDGLDAWRVPPLLLQAPLELALDTDGADGSLDPVISIRVRLEHRQLLLSILCEGMPPIPHGKWRSLQSRLESFFGPKAWSRVQTGPGRWSVEMGLPGGSQCA